MAQERKRLLIVDDTEIDRILLKSALCVEFEIVEADSGNAAFEYITTQGSQLDAILLDISMPHIDGFDVLKFMADKGISGIPVFLITAEPTRDNVEKALQYRVAGFISKPFNREDVTHRLRSRLGVVPDYDLRNEELKATQAYVADLKVLYQRYLANFGKSDESCQNVADLVRIMLQNLIRTTRDFRLNDNAVELISRAAYFCDIGEMLIPDRRMLALSSYSGQFRDIYQDHTVLGANLIRLNRSPQCGYFVEICSSMCLHHHERFDGEGYPEGLEGKNISIFNQLCRIADEFEHMRSKLYGDKSKPVKTVLKRVLNDGGMVSPLVYSLMEDCEPQIIDYFLKKGT